MIVVSVFMITGINVNNPINSDELRMIVKRFRIIFLMIMGKKLGLCRLLVARLKQLALPSTGSTSTGTLSIHIPVDKCV